MLFGFGHLILAGVETPQGNQGHGRLRIPFTGLFQNLFCPLDIVLGPFGLGQQHGGTELAGVFRQNRGQVLHAIFNSPQLQFGERQCVKRVGILRIGVEQRGKAFIRLCQKTWVRRGCQYLRHTDLGADVFRIQFDGFIEAAYGASYVLGTQVGQTELVICLGIAWLSL